MTARADLHVHTTASDGALTPSEVVLLASRLGLEALAITDHDTVAGIAEALEQAASVGLRLIPGIEISAEQRGVQAHLLGYYIDHTSQALIAWLEGLAASRLSRAQQMLAKLEQLGIFLSDGVLAEATESGVVGRPHIARALVEAGHAASIEEAFDRYLNPGQPAYLSRAKATPAEAIRMIRQAGGIPVLAHPWCTLFLLDELVAEGLLGLETHYRDYDRCQIGRLSRLAHERGLVCTGGTDFHGLPGETLPLGGIALPCDCLKRLEALHASLQSASHQA